MLEDVDQPQPRQEKRSGNWVLFSLVGILVLGAVVFGLFGNNSDVPQSESRISQVLDKPDDFIGQNIIISGQIERVIGSRAITIDSPQPLSQKLLVISKQPLEPIGGSGLEDFLFQKSDRVSVEGTVREFNLREMEEELGIDLIDDEFVEWEGRTVLVADKVEEER